MAKGKSAKSTNSKSAVIESLKDLLAETYTLRLRTQSVHWNIEGPLFYSIHTLTETLYNELALAADELAERIRALGEKSPASYEEFAKRSKIPGSAIEGSDQAMVKALVKDNETISKRLEDGIELAGDAGDDATEDMLIARLQSHEKTIWMLKSSIG